MKLKQLLQEDDAVSPVIGVILMVAITVILAAVIATFVLGLGEQVSSTAPSTSFSFDLNVTDNAGGDSDFSTDCADGSDTQGILTVRHAGGPTIDPSTVSLAGSSLDNDPAAWSDVTSDDISAGNSVDLCISTSDTVDITWESEGDSAILATYRGPDA